MRTLSNTLVQTSCALALIVSVMGPRSLYADSPRDLARRCYDAINRIGSYDVELTIDIIAYPNAHDPEKKDNPPERVFRSFDEVLRDVFAIGLGRRVESMIGDPDTYTIAVKDWDTARTGEKSLALNLSSGGESRTYLGLFNPNCAGYFLSELLAGAQVGVADWAKPSQPPHVLSQMDTAESKLTPLNARGTGNLPGIEIRHPRLDSYVRVWIDPEHGDMPKIIERYISDRNGKPLLQNIIEVDEYMKAGEAWVPIKGRYIQVVTTGATAGRESLASLITVNAKKSSWNSVDDAHLFAGTSLPVVNHQQSGWKEYLSPASLAAKERAKTLADSFIEMQQPGTSDRNLLIAVNVAILVLLVLFAVWTRRRKLTGFFH